MSEQIIDYQALWLFVTRQFALGYDSTHGPRHWQRVEENGLKLAEKTGARVDVVRLFAVFHDSKRLSEFEDPEHGPHGAAFAAEVRGKLYELDDAGFALLHEACSVHTALVNSPDVTIGTCLDADRLDLGRVGINPEPMYFSTPYGKTLCAKLAGK